MLPTTKYTEIESTTGNRKTFHFAAILFAILLGACGSTPGAFISRPSPMTPDRPSEDVVQLQSIAATQLNGDQLNGVAVDSANRWYVTIDGELAIYDSATTPLSLLHRTGQGGIEPLGGALDMAIAADSSDGDDIDVYVLINGAGRLAQFDFDSDSTALTRRPDVQLEMLTEQVVALAADSTNLYVVELMEQAARLQIYDRQTLSHQSSPLLDDIDRPSDIAVNNERAYIVDQGGNQLLIYRTSDLIARQNPQPFALLGSELLSSPQAVALDGASNIYVADSEEGAGRIHLFDSDAYRSTLNPPTNFGASLVALATDRNHHLLVADSSNTMLRYLRVETTAFCPYNLFDSSEILQRVSGGDECMATDADGAETVRYIPTADAVNRIDWWLIRSLHTDSHYQVIVQAADTGADPAVAVYPTDFDGASLDVQNRGSIIGDRADSAREERNDSDENFGFATDSSHNSYIITVSFRVATTTAYNLRLAGLSYVYKDSFNIPSEGAHTLPPEDITFDEDGTVYVNNAEFITLIDPENITDSRHLLMAGTGNTEESLESVGRAISFFNGRLYATIGNNLKSYSIATSESRIRDVVSFDLSGGPNSIAFDSAGRLYTTGADNKALQIFSINGSALELIHTIDDMQLLMSPSSVTVGTDGRIYVVDNHRLQVFSPSFSYLATIGSGESSDANPLKAARNVALREGQIYITADSFDEATIRIYNSDYAPLHIIDLSGEDDETEKPNGIAFDSEGLLYVSDASDRSVARFCLLKCPE